MDISDPAIRADRTFEICVFELSNASTDTPDISKPIRCYLLTNPSIAEIQIFWYNPGRANGMASHAVMEDLGAQYFWDFRESRAADSMFQFFYRDTARDAFGTMFCYDDPRGGVWTLDLEGNRLKEAMKGGGLRSSYKVFEEFGGRYHGTDCECPELEEVRRSKNGYATSIKST